MTERNGLLLCFEPSIIAAIFFFLSSFVVFVLFCLFVCFVVFRNDTSLFLFNLFLF